MEGTLSWLPLADSYVTDLASDDYEQLTIIDVEVPLKLAVEQSTHRWWAAREAGRTVDHVELGGRFITQAALELLQPPAPRLEMRRQCSQTPDHCPQRGHQHRPSRRQPHVER